MNSTLLKHALSLLIVVLLSLVVWLGGEQFRLPRGAIIVGIVTVWAVLTGVSQLLARRGAAQIESTLRQQAAAFAQSARPDRKAEIDDLRRQFETALDMLKRSRRGKTALHSLPVYVLIGPPGSGKTTMLRESSLDFPFMTGRREIRGVGGTRNCDWWFGSRGILLDTAGRFVVENDDREEWLAFLGMVRKARPRRPINGAVIGVSITDVIHASDVELRSLGEQIRERVDELVQHLQVVFPVYLVFTKCDQLSGFVEFFGRFSKEQRKQIWGFTLPFERGTAAAASFASEFDELYRRLTAMRLDHFLNEGPRKERDKRYAFPLQFALTRQRLADFLAQLQQSNPYQESAPIRGVYFTSGTQERSQVDTLIDKISVVAEVPAEVPRDQRKCYFIDDVFEKVAFADAELAEPTVDANRKRTWARRVGVAAAAVVGMAMLYLGGVTWASGQEKCTELARLSNGLERSWRSKGQLSVEEVAALDRVRQHLVDGGERVEATAAAALRDLLHARLRESLVRQANEFVMAKVSSIKPDPQSPDWPKRFGEVQDKINALLTEADAWLAVHEHFTEPARAASTTPGATEGEDAASNIEDVVHRDKHLDAWRSGANTGVANAPSLWRLYDYFGEHRKLLRSRATGDVVNAVRELEAKCNRILNDLWEEFVGLPRVEKLKNTYAALATAKEEMVPLLGDGLGALDLLFVEPLAIERAWTKQGERAVTQTLDDEVANLRRLYCPRGDCDKDRKGVFDRLASAFRQELEQQTRDAWADRIAKLTPKEIKREDDPKQWLGGTELVPTLAERIADGYHARFAPEAPAGPEDSGSANRDRPRSGLRDLAKPYEELDKKFASEVGLTDCLAALRTFADAVPKRESLGLRTTGGALPQDVRDHLITLEAAALRRILDRLAQPAIAKVNEAWRSGPKGRLDDARQQFPFDPNAIESLADDKTAELFDEVPAALEDIAKFLREDRQRDWQQRVAVTQEAKKLGERLATLKRVLGWQGKQMRAPFAVRWQTHNAGPFVFQALGKTLTEGVDAARWVDLEMTVQTTYAAFIKVRDVELTGELRGTWSFLRLLRLRQGDEVPADANAPRKVTWELGKNRDNPIKFSLELQRPSPVVDLLLDNSAFELPDVPDLVASRPK